MRIMTNAEFKVYVKESLAKARMAGDKETVKMYEDAVNMCDYMSGPALRRWKRDFLRRLDRKKSGNG